MIIHQLRNATMVVEVAEHRLLVDPTSLVVANHLEALNHCPTTRVEREWLQSEGLCEKVQIPADGESLEFC